MEINQCIQMRLGKKGKRKKKEACPVPDNRETFH